MAPPVRPAASFCIESGGAQGSTRRGCPGREGGAALQLDKLLAEHPWLGKAIFDAFLEAKNQYVAGLRAGKLTSADDKKYAGFMPLVGDDPLPYGLKNNLASINAMIEYTYQQKMIPRKFTAREVFVDL